MLPALLLLPALIAQAPAPSLRPGWIAVLPAQPGRVYGLGVAALTTDAAALRQAADNARADVISRLRASVQADTRVSTVLQETRASGGAAAGSRTQTTQVDTQVQARATDLPGLVVQETYLDRAGATGYALAYLDLAVAEAGLASRFAALKADLAAERPQQGPRGRLVQMQVLKRGHEELLRLDDLAGLLGGGGAAGLRAEVLGSRLETERRLAAARSALTFGLAPATGIDLDPDAQDLVRNAVLKEGMGWSDQKPLFAITLRVRGGGAGRRAWWERQRAADFIVAQGSLSLALVDSAGQQYESLTIVAKGVGVNEFQADSLLLADCRAKLGKAVAAWLADLGKW